MAAASDKARFYLERYVPELQEYERKEIFASKEITAIISKRSDFEHTLNARGSRPADYMRYATYEMNLNSLRKKRCKRLGVKMTTSFNGTRTIFFILDRATKKFPGELSLWIQYIEYCRQEKAAKKLSKVFTAALRLFPREWNIWVLAAKCYVETEGDIGTARSYLQRGLRFCKAERRLYLEYAKLELVYLAKLAARRRILGLDEAHGQKTDDTEDMIALPSITASEIDPKANMDLDDTTVDALRRLSAAPAFSGAIPIAIYDAAMEQFDNDDQLSEEFFDLVARFDNVHSSLRILRHILTHMQEHSPTSAETLICDMRTQLFSTRVQSTKFPLALRGALTVLNTRSTRVTERQYLRLHQGTIYCLLPFLRDTEGVDTDIVQVLIVTIKRQLELLEKIHSKSISESRAIGSTIVEGLKNEGRNDDAEILQRLITDAGYSLVSI